VPAQEDMSSPPTDDAASAKADLVPGVVLGGKFRVERVVGRGGMGVVVEATNLQLDQKVAVKLLATRTEEPEVIERFHREAKAAARLRSEHVARVFDAGRDTLHGPFLVMELLEGQTLADVLAKTGRVPLHRAIEYVINTCEALAEAHSRGIIHQDVKPANLFLVMGPDGRPSVKLLDFGIATVRSKGRDGDPKSSHRSLGTPAYLAPEQLRHAAEVTHRADVWALGCVLYELIVGQRPFRATRFTELVTAILETPPEPIPPELDVPPAVTAAILRCLERDPEKRFGSTAQLALALLPFARSRAHLAATRAVAHATTSGLDPHLRMPSSLPPPPESLSSSSIELPPSSQLRAPAVPRFSGPAAAGMNPAPNARARGIVPLALGAIFLVCALVGWLLLGTPKKTSTALPDVEPSGGPAAPVVKAAPPSPSTPSSAESAPTRSAPAPSESARPVVPSATVTHAPVARPTRPSTPAAPTKTSGESDIRYER
jgi:serine/threonine-protein kinase